MTPFHKPLRDKVHKDCGLDLLENLKSARISYLAFFFEQFILNCCLDTDIKNLIHALVRYDLKIIMFKTARNVLTKYLRLLKYRKCNL